jgi:branched-chain amino acid aminotransferase
VRSADGDFVIGGQAVGPVTSRLRAALVDIQRGDAPDPYGWIEVIR